VAEQVIVVSVCPSCGQANALLTKGRVRDSGGQLVREWLVSVDCANEKCPTYTEPTAVPDSRDERRPR
jgi:hypothetical protein